MSAPIPDRDGEFLHRLSDRPAAVVALRPATGPARSRLLIAARSGPFLQNCTLRLPVFDEACE